MYNLVIQPQNQMEYMQIANILKQNNISFSDNEILESKIIEAENPELSPVQMFGFWKDENISLKSLRKKTWRKLEF